VLTDVTWSLVIGIVSPYCQRSPGGHVAAPPSSVMNSRRLTASPSLLETAPYHIVEWGSILHHSKFDSLMAG
jgi:hypothetical protein